MARTLWLWKRRHKINIRESDCSRSPDQVRGNGVGPQGRFIYVDVIISYLPVFSFVRCAAITWGWAKSTFADRSDVPSVTLPVGWWSKNQMEEGREWWECGGPWQNVLIKPELLKRCSSMSSKHKYNGGPSSHQMLIKKRKKNVRFCDVEIFPLSCFWTTDVYTLEHRTFNQSETWSEQCSAMAPNWFYWWWPSSLWISHLCGHSSTNRLL